MTQRPFPPFSELQLWEDGVSTVSRHLDAVDAAVSRRCRSTQNSPMKFAHFFFLCEAVVFAGTSLLIFCGCCARDFEMANNYATVFFCLFMMCPRPAPVASTAPVTRNPHRSRRPLHQQQVDPGRREVDRGRELLQLGHLCGEPLGATRFR